MSEAMNLFFYGILPYVVLSIAIIGTTQRYITDQFSISSLSSQFLENRKLFLGTILWHFGILVVLLGHLVAFMIPKTILAFNSVPLRLYILEGTALIFALSAFFGLILFIERRLTQDRIRVVTSPMDYVLFTLLFIQVATGLYIAIFHRWGSSWYALTAVPYLRSIWVLNPQIQYVVDLPLMVQAHMINAFLLIGIFPFTRLPHMLVIPFGYLVRPYQIVIFNRKK
ncbi:MAG: Nitrate reductase-like protein NarX [Chlamydiae bacterium]|nr:Nitrate reductase-like protein NarX [Chlamydiota bacterium]